MAGPAPIQRGWPDFQDPAGAGVALLTAQALNFTTSVTYGPFDISTYESLSIYMTRTGGTSVQGYYRTTFAYVDTTGTVVNMSSEQMTFSSTNSPDMVDFQACQGPVAYFSVNVGAGTTFIGTLRVTGKNGPLQPSSTITNPMVLFSDPAMAAGGNNTAYATSIRRGWGTLNIFSSTNLWVGYLQAIDSAGVWQNVFYSQGDGIRYNVSMAIPVPPSQTRILIFNTSAAVNSFYGTLYMGGI